LSGLEIILNPRDKPSPRFLQYSASRSQNSAASLWISACCRQNTSIALQRVSASIEDDRLRIRSRYSDIRSRLLLIDGAKDSTLCFIGDLVQKRRFCLIGFAEG